MAVTVTHATVTAVPDDPAYDIGSDEWNAAHSVSGLGTAAESAATDFVAVVGDTMTGTLTSTIGTVTADTPALAATQTWNDAGVTFTALKINATSTASASGSKLLDCQESGVSQFYVRKDGACIARYVYGLQNSPGSWDWAQLGTSQYIAYGGVIKFSDGDALAGTPDIGIARNAAGVVEVNSSSAGTFRDLKARNVITPGVTVASLAGAAQGARSFVTDATQTLTAGIGATVAGGGANAVPVVYDGTNWLIG